MGRDSNSPACSVDVADTDNFNERDEQQRQVANGEIKQLQPVFPRALTEHEADQKTEHGEHTCQWITDN